MNPILEIEAEEILKNPITEREILLCEYMGEYIEQKDEEVKDAEDRAELCDEECNVASEKLDEAREETDAVKMKLDEALDEIWELKTAAKELDAAAE